MASFCELLQAAVFTWHNIILYFFLLQANEFLSGAENWASEGSSLEGVMYLGQSLGRVGCDLRGLAIPYYLSGTVNQLKSILETSLSEFPLDMDKAALTSVHVRKVILLTLSKTFYS